MLLIRDVNHINVHDFSEYDNVNTLLLFFFITKNCKFNASQESFIDILLFLIDFGIWCLINIIIFSSKCNIVISSGPMSILLNGVVANRAQGKWPLSSDD